MPREWHDRHAANQIANPEKRKFYRDIVADKKPYFMRYIYPDLMKQYNTYIRNTNRNALREFQMTIDEMRALPEEQLTDRQLDFLRYYRARMPVGVGDCVMNKICRRFEEEFDRFIGKTFKGSKFDYSILKSGDGYSYSQKLAVQKLYDEYNKKLHNYVVFSYYQRIDDDESASSVTSMREEFLRECETICQNATTLCDILLDICYCRSSTKKFVWEICADTIISNLLAKNNFEISAPVKCDDGEVEYCGSKYKVITKKLEELNEYYPE